MADQEVVIVGEDGTEHVFPPGFDPKKAASIVRQQPNGPRQRTWTDTAVDALPVAGGLVGGLVGGAGGTVAGFGVGGAPGAIGGAALGGAAGEAAKQLVNHARGVEAPATPADAATSIGEQGAIQGVSELAGQGLVAGARAAAPKLMGAALHLTDKLAREFPELSTTMIDHVLTVTEGGLSRARALLTSAKNTANAALASAHAAGATVPATAATDGLMRTVGHVMNSADIEGGIATLASVERNTLAGRAGDLTPMEADALKRSLQTQSKSLYRSAAMGDGRPNVTIKAQALADMAQSLNNSLGDITTAAGAPGYRAANADAADLIGATRGIRRGMQSASSPVAAMLKPGAGALIGAAGGYESGGVRGAEAGAAMGALASHAMASPSGLSRAAVVLSRPGVQILLRQAPRVAAAVAQYLQQAQESPEP